MVQEQDLISLLNAKYLAIKSITDEVARETDRLDVEKSFAAIILWTKLSIVGHIFLVLAIISLIFHQVNKMMPIFALICLIAGIACCWIRYHEYRASKREIKKIKKFIATSYLLVDEYRNEVLVLLILLQHRRSIITSTPVPRKRQRKNIDDTVHEVVLASASQNDFTANSNEVKYVGEILNQRI
uniref:Uncharacterized protein n=1 Tax=Panagrolaimus sp. JU765 TaxID=591449 RepID=A0AC34RB33_9BILA